MAIKIPTKYSQVVFNNFLLITLLSSPIISARSVVFVVKVTF